MADQDGEVVDNREEGRFELDTDVGLALLNYDRRDGLLYLIHTDVPPAAKGRGIGSRLVQQVLDRARAQGVKIVPWCPFVRAYIDRHPEYRDIIARTM